jgi:hypothetical protein
MKSLFLITTIFISILTFGQDTPSWAKDLHLFNVDLKGKKFEYLDPKTYTLYNNISVGGEGIEDTAAVIKLFDFKNKQQIRKYYHDEKNNYDQVITGSYWFDFNKESIAIAEKIVKECSSTQELLNRMKVLDDQPMISISNFNGKEKNAAYYTIGGFYYTIEKSQDGSYMLYTIFPIGKERKLNESR